MITFQNDLKATNENWHQQFIYNLPPENMSRVPNFFFNQKWKDLYTEAITFSLIFETNHDFQPATLT